MLEDTNSLDAAHVTKATFYGYFEQWRISIHATYQIGMELMSHVCDKAFKICDEVVRILHSVNNSRVKNTKCQY